MTRWLGDPPRKPHSEPPDPENVTDDPLAALGFESSRGVKGTNKGQVYSVSRVNPLFNLSKSNHHHHHKPAKQASRQKSPEVDYDEEEEVSYSPREKSSSSGYEGSNGSSFKSVEDTGALVDINPSFVKSIRIAGRGLKPLKSVPSHMSCSSSGGGGGTLTTIPEGHLPQPIWPGPLEHRLLLNGCSYDSIIDEALLLFTAQHQNLDISAKDLLLDLLTSMDQALEGHSPEEVLKIISEKIRVKLEALRLCTEEEMRRLCVNLSNCRKVNSVLRAFSHSSTSSSSRARTSSSNEEDFYQSSSNSGFSDSPPGRRRTITPLLPYLYGRKPSTIFSHCDHSSTISRGIRNALIYGTLCRHKGGHMGTAQPLEETCKAGMDKVSARDGNAGVCCDKSGVVGEKERVSTVVGVGVGGVEKPSVWQQYYGVKVEGRQCCGEVSPKDVPVFPGGRPETDFTLDVPRSELLSKRLREDKKWRFRCRVLTSFLGLVFFLLSVMAVSLILTRGKRMFGSMV
ncbi:uncharacterized protein [Euwallacea similis]|uniref:uncharacterized protein n=1 Tax=Euwallacea similis TaxID=1736056 RepID=UPI00344D88F2